MESKRIVQRTFSGHIRAVHLPLQRLSLTRSTPLQLSPRVRSCKRQGTSPDCHSVRIRTTDREYYKWQFINSIVLSGLYPKDYVGVEVHFPKGNKGSAALKLDAAIFDDPAWVDHYNAYWADYTPSHLEWLNEHLIAVVEFKKGDKDRATLISLRSFDKDDEGEHTPP
jgi:hypothetical protein